MLFARVAQLATVAVALFCGSQANASPTIYGAYYDETAENLSCTTTCEVHFSQLLPNKLLMVRKVMCYISSQGRPVQAAFLVGDGAGGHLSRHFILPLPASPTAPSDGYYRTTVDINPDWLIGQSRLPYVFVYAPAGQMSIDCTFRGDLVDPIQ